MKVYSEIYLTDLFCPNFIVTSYFCGSHEASCIMTCLFKAINENIESYCSVQPIKIPLSLLYLCFSEILKIMFYAWVSCVKQEHSNIGLTFGEGSELYGGESLQIIHQTFLHMISHKRMAIATSLKTR